MSQSTGGRGPRGQLWPPGEVVRDQEGRQQDRGGQVNGRWMLRKKTDQMPYRGALKITNYTVVVESNPHTHVP